MVSSTARRDSPQPFHYAAFTFIPVPHCHGDICWLDPVRKIVYLSREFDVATQARAFADAIDRLTALDPPRLRLVP